MPTRGAGIKTGVRHGSAVALLALSWICVNHPHARAAETGPVVVVPGRAGVPVMMDGYDVSGAVIEGDWGLARPGNINPVVIYQYGRRALIGTPGGRYLPRHRGAPRNGGRW